jgi:predicted enzyme related to lactoylglutathione lyase
MVYTASVGSRAVIKALHTLLYSDDPSATRAFFRDVLGWPYVEDPESEPGWLIFKTGPSELGVHPTSGTFEGKEYSSPVHHVVSLMCDDIEATVAELEARGAEFGAPVDEVWGIGRTLKVPGAGGVVLYEPRHPEAHSL